MKSIQLSQTRLTRPRLLSFFSIISLMFSLAVFCQIGQAQQQPAQLSLADVLIALRSKKATLDERNKILSEAVKVRGITFSLAPEIEIELAGTGANGELIEAIRQKSLNVKVSAVTKPAPPAAAAPAPVLDYAFYRKRADENAAKGEYDSAVSDYGKAIELSPKDAAAHLQRGRAYVGKQSYDLAMLDLNKTIEFNPKESAAYFIRGELHERRGNSQQALEDYRKALEFDAANEAAKNNLKRLQDEQAKLEQAKIEQAKIEQAKIEQAKIEQEKLLAKAKAAEAAPAVESSNAPTAVVLGSLIGQAVKLVSPIYTPLARQQNIAGQVTVQVSLDEEGSVTSAKASSGPAMLRATSEEAVRRTKFRPATLGGKPIKASGFIVYNFTGK